MDPRTIAEVAGRLRTRSVALLDSLSDEQLAAPALPARRPGGSGWSVADVFRHLAESDRRSVLGYHLLEFLPSQDETAFEDANDEALERLRGADRTQLREELITWGRRLQRVIRLTPRVVARRTVPTMFGRVSLAWFSMLRVYDEWVHEDDVRRALQLPPRTPGATARGLLAEFHLRALPAGPLREIPQTDAVVEVSFPDVLTGPDWRFDLRARQFGVAVTAEPTARIETDVPTWCRIAADRIEWRQAESDRALRIEGDDREAAEAILGRVRVV